jgi:serine/threonine protein kinase
MIGDQMLRILQWVHQCGIVHRDIKPQNFVVGRGKLRNKIFLSDFGISMPYLDLRTHAHEDCSRNNGLVGTIQYVSRNAHVGEQHSRRDDLESAMYVLLRFLRGSLPWSKIKDKDEDVRLEKVVQSKLQTSVESLCQSFPKELKDIMEKIRKKKYDVQPKYPWMRTRLRNVFVRYGFVYDGGFDWDDNAPIHRPIPAVYLRQSARHYQLCNERHLKERRRGVEHYLPPHRPMFMAAWE